MTEGPDFNEMHFEFMQKVRCVMMVRWGLSLGKHTGSYNRVRMELYRVQNCTTEGVECPGISFAPIS